jgi:hypothetical protein
MRKIIEHTLISIDGVVENPQLLGFMEYRDRSHGCQAVVDVPGPEGVNLRHQQAIAFHTAPCG